VSRSARGLDLDWVRGPGAAGAVWNRVVGGLAAAVITLAIVVGYLEYRRLALENELADLRADIERRQRHAADDAAKQRPDPARDNAVRYHNEIVTVLTAVERVALDGVQIDELTMRPEVPEFRIEARAVTAAAAQTYVASLNDSDPEGGWTIVQIRSLVREPGFGFSAASLKRHARPPAAALAPSK
jgi:hypothetical protein